MKQQDRYYFPAVFTYEPGQEIAVVFPDLDVATSGVTQEDAFRSARELLGCVLFGMEEDGEAIPAPSSLESLHMDANERSALIDVYMPAVRLAKSGKTVYPIVLTPDPSGGYVVRVPGLDINTEGETVPECIDMAREAIGLWGICEEDSGRAVPAPASLSPEHEPGEIVTLVDVDFDFFRRS